MANQMVGDEQWALIVQLLPGAALAFLTSLV
jgi:hypothetical protein